MTTDQVLSSVVKRIVAAQSFDDAANIVVTAMLDAMHDELGRDDVAGRGRVLRGVVHLRPSSGYQRIYPVEYGDTRRDSTGAPAALVSATAWALVSQRKCQVTIDVGLQKAFPWLEEIAPAALEGGLEIAFRSTSTLDYLRARKATHVHVMPLRIPGGAVRGMISLESFCQAAIGRRLLPRPFGELLQSLADVAAPYLAALPPGLAAPPPTDELLPVIGKQTAGIREVLRVFSEEDETILLAGPTGAGKSRLAQWCHAKSQRSRGPFEVLDLLSVPEDLQGGTLFGWRRGAFTGADRSHDGSVARARGGTLFIDEIDKLSLAAQASLLRVLESQVYQPLGGTECNADVRFIIGTNADLRAEMNAGRFRKDLYYRINVLPVVIPSLAERRDEIRDWAEYMLSRRHREGKKRGRVQITDAAAALLVDRDWPGNLRQLDNIVRRSYVFAVSERAGEGLDLVVDEGPVMRALEYEQQTDDPGDDVRLKTRLMAAARKFVDKLAHSTETPSPTLDSIHNVFRSYVIVAALERARGRKDDAFRSIGKGELIKNRNHTREIKKATQCIAEFERAMGEAEGRD